MPYHRGQGNACEEAFRADYGRLSELRSILKKEVPFVALTATATEAVSKQIVLDLAMTGCVPIISLPDKPNTKFSVVSIDQEDLYGAFSWLINELDKSQLSAPKTLVFCRKRSHVRQLYELFELTLGPRGYVCTSETEPHDDRTRLFAMYHKKTHKLVKETVEKEFCKADGSVRVVFCTIAFGMGVNVQGANTAIHLGPSGGIDDYLQECGRVGRDSSEKSYAVLLKYKGCTSSKNITKPMKDYVKNTTICRRQLLMRQFSTDINKNAPHHACCDVCARDCRCLCKCHKKICTCDNKCNSINLMSPIETHLQQSSDSKKKGAPTDAKLPEISRKARQKIRSNLLEYRAELGSSVPHEKLLTGLDLATGFSRALIEDIVSKVECINSEDVLREMFPFFSTEHAKYTWETISDVLEDSDSESNSSCDSDDSDVMEYRVRKLCLESSSDDDMSD